MKKDIHPAYDFVIFKDFSTGFSFLTKSTRTSDKKEKWEDGKEYPIIEVEISSASHPFYTGQQRLVDSAGRIDKFKRKYSKTENNKKQAKK